MFWLPKPCCQTANWHQWCRWSDSFFFFCHFTRLKALRSDVFFSSQPYFFHRGCSALHVFFFAVVTHTCFCHAVGVWVCVCVLPQNKYGAFERAKPILGSSQLRMQNIFPNVFSECCRLGCRRNRKTLRPTLLPLVRSFVFMNSSWRHGKIASWLVRYENLFYTPRHATRQTLFRSRGLFCPRANYSIFTHGLISFYSPLRKRLLWVQLGFFFFFQEHSVHVFSDS